MLLTPPHKSHLAIRLDKLMFNGDIIKNTIRKYKTQNVITTI